MTALASNQWIEQYGPRLRKYAYCCCAVAIAMFFYLFFRSAEKYSAIWTYEDTYWMAGGYLAFSIAAGLLLRFSGRSEWREWTFVGLPASVAMLGLLVLGLYWPWGSSTIFCCIGWVMYAAIRLVYGKSQERLEKLAYALLAGMVLFLFGSVCLISAISAFILARAQAYQLNMAGRIIDDMTSDIKVALCGIAISFVSMICLCLLERKRLIGRGKKEPRRNPEIPAD